MREKDLAVDKDSKVALRSRRDDAEYPRIARDCKGCPEG